jgi:hypothetical protein
LTLTGSLISLKALRNNRIGLTINTCTTSSFRKFENIEWSSDDEYVLEFELISEPSEIFIEVKGEVERYNDNPQQLEASKYIRCYEESSNCAEFFLCQDGRDYVLMMLGRNG